MIYFYNINPFFRQVIYCGLNPKIFRLSYERLPPEKGLWRMGNRVLYLALKGQVKRALCLKDHKPKQPFPGPLIKDRNRRVNHKIIRRLGMSLR